MAQQEVLEDGVATQFCGTILPQLIAEIEVLQRLADAKFPAAFADPVAPVEQPAADTNEKPADKPAKKRSRRKPSATRPRTRRSA